MNHFDIIVDLFDKYLNIALNNDGECTSQFVQYFDNINLKVLGNLLTIIIRDPFQDCRSVYIELL